MKNDGQPIRDSVPWNFRCTKDPHWLNKIFLFGTEIWADQLKNNPVWLFVCYIEVSDIINIEGARYYIDVIVLFLPLICFEDIFLIEHFIPYLDMFLRTFLFHDFCLLPSYVFADASWPDANLEQRSQLSGTDLYVSTWGKTFDELQSQQGPPLYKRTSWNEIQRVLHRNSDWFKLCFSYSVLKMRRVTYRMVQEFFPQFVHIDMITKLLNTNE